MAEQESQNKRMFLSELKLWNFRQFGAKSTQYTSETNPNLVVPFNNGMNVLIGRNDSGKTAIVDAIKYVLRTHSYERIWISPEDFHHDERWFRIELKFEGFSDEEAGNFPRLLGWEGTGENSKPFLRLVYMVERDESGKIRPVDVLAGPGESTSTLEAFQKEKLKVTYLKPLRDAQAELVPKRGSRLSRILMGHEAFKDRQEDHPLIGDIETFKCAIENYFKGKNDADEVIDEGKGKALKEEIDSLISDFYSDEKSSRFSVLETQLHQLLEKLKLSLEGEVNPGLGSLNRLFIATELLHLEKENGEGLRLGLIEELEAHLHPQAQMRIVSSLQKKKNVQTILTTHSTLLGSKIELDNLILCDGKSAFSLRRGKTKLKPDDYEFLEWFLDATKANLFFALGVIIVEGISEELLLPAFAMHMRATKKIKQDITSSGVSIVNVGNTGFLHYSRIFLREAEGEKLDIPVSVLTDVDVRHYKKTPKLDSDGKQEIENGKRLWEYLPREGNDITTESQTKITDLITEHEIRNVRIFCGTEWTLEYCLLKSTELGEVFKQTVLEIHPQMTEENFENELAKKLIDKSLKKSKIAYSLASKIREDAMKDEPTLEIGGNRDEGIKDTIDYIIDSIKYASRN